MTGGCWSDLQLGGNTQHRCLEDELLLSRCTNFLTVVLCLLFRWRPRGTC
jgi:hypothetical protein